MSNLDRRTMLKLAAALGADRAMPTTISPAEAALLLEQPPAFDGAMPQDRVDEADWQDPEEFAAALVGVGGVALDWFQDGAAEELAAYKQSAARMLAAFGVVEDDLACDHPFILMDESVVLLATMGFLGGVRAGAAAEHLRLARTAARMLWQGCRGRGFVWSEAPIRRDPSAVKTTCRACGGAGTVPTPPARLRR